MTVWNENFVTTTKQQTPTHNCRRTQKNASIHIVYCSFYGFYSYSLQMEKALFHLILDHLTTRMEQKLAVGRVFGDIYGGRKVIASQNRGRLLQPVTFLPRGQCFLALHIFPLSCYLKTQLLLERLNQNWLNWLQLNIPIRITNVWKKKTHLIGDPSCFPIVFCLMITSFQWTCI